MKYSPPAAWTIVVSVGSRLRIYKGERYASVCLQQAGQNPTRTHEPTQAKGREKGRPPALRHADTSLTGAMKCNRK
jgi:hypothetical protein